MTDTAVTADSFEISRVLIVSTAHITEADSTMLTDDAYPSAQLNWDYGHWLYVPDRADDLADLKRDCAVQGFSNEMTEWLTVAFREKVQWLRFDADGNTYAGYPTFEW